MEIESTLSSLFDAKIYQTGVDSRVSLVKDLETIDLNRSATNVRFYTMTRAGLNREVLSIPLLLHLMSRQMLKYLGART